jgi:hypothetical protein
MCNYWLVWKVHCIFLDRRSEAGRATVCGLKFFVATTLDYVLVKFCRDWSCGALRLLKCLCCELETLVTSAQLFVVGQKLYKCTASVAKVGYRDATDVTPDFPTRASVYVAGSNISKLFINN